MSDAIGSASPPPAKHSAEVKSTNPEKSGTPAQRFVMATLQDDDERLLAQIGYKQVRHASCVVSSARQLMIFHA